MDMRKIIFAFIILIVSIGIFSCEEEGLIGDAIIPETDKMQNYFDDSFTVKTITEHHDSISIVNHSNTVFGIYEDEVFGRTRASWVAEFIPSSDTIVFEDDMNIDSVVLYLGLYDNAPIPHYGAPSTKIGMRIYELSEVLPRDSLVEDDFTPDGKFYQSALADISFNINNQIITISETVVEQLQDSVDADVIEEEVLDEVKLFQGYEFLTFDDLTTALQQNTSFSAETLGIIEDAVQYESKIRIKLPESFVANLNNKGVTGNISYIEWREDFLNGLFFEPYMMDDKGVLIQLKPSVSSTKMTMYYKETELNDDDEPELKNFTYNFNANSMASSFNIVEHNYSNTDFYTHINTENPEQQQYTYLQGTGGLRVKIELPDLKEKLSDVNINKADLRLPVLPGSYDTIRTPLPYAVQIYNIGTDGRKELLDEYQKYNNSTGVVSAILVNFDEDNEEFRFNISHFIQQVIDEKRVSNGLYIEVAYPEYNIGRAIIGSAINHEYKTRLEVYYTNIINSNIIH